MNKYSCVMHLSSGKVIKEVITDHNKDKAINQFLYSHKKELNDFIALDVRKLNG